MGEEDNKEQDKKEVIKHVDKHKMRNDGRPAEYPALQLAVSSRELSDEVLPVPRVILAAAQLRGRGREAQNCGLRIGKDGGGLRG